MSLTGKTRLAYRSKNNQHDDFIFNKIKLEFQCTINTDEVIDHYNIFWIRDGEADYSIDFNTYNYTGNTLIFLNPGEIFKVNSERLQEGYRIGFNNDFYCLDARDHEIGCTGLLFNDLVGSRHLSLSSELDTELLYLFNEIEKTLSKNNVAKTELLQSLLKVVLIKCVQLKKEKTSNYQIQPIESWVTEFNRLVEQNYKQWHSVSSYAKSFNLSSKSLTKKMAIFGKRPSQIIQKRIILEAKRQLFQSDRSIKEIAFDLGFKDPPHFTKFFKNKTQVTPTQFRKDIRTPIKS